MTLLRGDLLAGRGVAVGAGVDASVAGLLADLGASVRRLGDAASAEDGHVETLHAIVHDVSRAFARGGESGLTAALQDAWEALGAVAGETMSTAGGGGKVVLIAPRARAGRYADAARAGVENLARTLSIEWARYGITVTAIAPGRRTREEEVALLVAFLLSSAGDYYSGCRFELGAVG